ncbi:MULTISPECIES: YihY/virulence factor BrkB family protein [Clostridia]|uniref:YihY/virulence factor BrkB family protein n=1 Tax=Clostridium sp. CCUG 7971 TaxID=2811414 RepID=UPI001ABBD85A|nr:YihY/virulence factor BrkB family protein [Clostridium sp. CCUG 7971]MBO3446177.1 YihY/virulence factor BrkB family protein [Clostridium sp. CCUG 7971]
MVKVDKQNIKNIIQESNYSEINSKAAEMSFYLLLSLFPFLMFTISSIVYIPILHLNKYIGLVENIMPESAFVIVLSIINSARSSKSISFIIMSFFLTVWTSSRAVRAIIRGANKSYRVKETRSYIKVFIIGLLFTVGLLLLIFSSMIFLVYGEKIGYFLFDLIGLDNIFINIWDVCRYTIGIITIILILMNLYKHTPNQKLSTRESIPGAIIATFGWILVSFFYSYYSNYFANYEVIYGSIGGIIVLITWIYLSSWAILIGSEINARLYFRRKNR